MEDFLELFPRLSQGHFRLTSPATSGYNCIAWASEDEERWWWPDEEEEYYWPSTIPRIETLGAFQLVYSQLGYEECAVSDYEEGWQKIAIFVDRVGTPTHAARQLPSGIWTSKCGEGEDIEHELVGLEGRHYGRAICFMRRKVVVDEP